MNILFKYPSRGRYDRFIDGMDSIVNNLADIENYEILVTADYGDDAMKGLVGDERFASYKNKTVCYGKSDSKVHAINKDIELATKKWDIIVNMADDMRWVFYGFDEIIRQQFADGDLDKLIHIPDQDAKNILATMYIAGRTYYERLGYIYNPIYSSLFCDDEAQAIAKHLGKYHYVDCPNILMHLNSAYGHLPKDDLFIHQQEIGWTKDMKTFEERKLINFGL
jgi:hypothetical protein